MIPARLNINILKDRSSPWERFQRWTSTKVFAHPSTILKMFVARALVAGLGSVGWGVTGAVALSVVAVGLLLGGEYIKHCGYVALGIVSGGIL